LSERLQTAQEAAVAHLDEVHVVVAGGEDEVDISRVLNLSEHGIKRLMVADGQSIYTQFMTAG